MRFKREFKSKQKELDFLNELNDLISKRCREIRNEIEGDEE